MTLSNDFTEKTIDPDPFVQFKSWYSEHLTTGIAIPEAVTLATSAKMVRSLQGPYCLKVITKMDLSFIQIIIAEKALSYYQIPLQPYFFTGRNRADK